MRGPRFVGSALGWVHVLALPVAAGAQGTLADYQRATTVNQRLAATGYQVVNALIPAGKNFDLLVVPNGGHGAGGQYAIRKRNDFFVQWLLGVQPPNWNAGDSSLRVGSLSSFHAESQMQPSFYDGPNEAQYVWW